MKNGQYSIARHSVASRIANLVGLSKSSPDEHAPSVENLEPRVLLSANPITETVRYQDNDLLNNQPVIIMPLSTAQGNSIAPLAEQLATITILSPEKSAFHNGQIDVKADIVKGDNDISKWTVKLIYEDGRAYTLKSGNGLPASDHLLTFNGRSYGAGACRIEIEVLDKAGNTTIASQAFTIDVAAPTISIASPAYNAYQKETFEVIGSVSDSDTADDQISWTLSIKDGNGLVVIVQEGVGKRDKAVLGTIDPTRFISGNYTLILDARDAAGNIKSTTLPVRLDGFAPEVTLSSDIQEIDSQQYVTFTIGATDDVGVYSRKLIINGTAYNVGSNGVLRVRLDKAGIFEAVAEVTDAAGNVGRAAMQISVRDAYKPEVSLNAPANNATLGSSTEVYAYIRDYDSPSVVWKLTLTNKATGETYVVAEDIRATTGSYDRVLLGRLDPSKYANGDYLLTMEIVDTAGNTAKSEISLKLDTVAPVIESVSMNQTAVETFKPVIFTVNASDNFAVTRYEMYINGEKVTVASNGKSSGYTFKEAGIYRVEAYAYDAAGNVATYSFDLAVVETADLKAPVITINSPYNNYAYNKSVPVQVYIRDTDSLIINWTVTLVDNATGKKTILGAGDREAYYQTVATLNPADYADGSYTVLVEAVDKGGNRSVASNTFIIDTVKPEVSVAPETSRLEVGQTVWLQISETDTSTISRRTLQINGKSVTVDANGRAKYVFEAPGEYTLVATVTDAAGNIGTITKILLVAENTDFIAPTVEITSPDVKSYVGGMTSIRATISDGDSENVTWTVRLRYPNGTSATVLATGSGMATDAELVSFNAASYASGVYTIEIEVVDPAGNKTLATREINIDRYAPTVSISGPAANAYVKDAVEVTGTLSDRDTATEFVSWAVTLKNTVTGEIFTVATSKDVPADGRFATIDPTLYASGTYTLTLEAVDAGGNKASTYRTIRIDAVAPEVALSSDIQEIDSWQYVTFTIGATDDVGVYSRKLIINGTTYNVGSNGVLRIRLDKAGIFEAVAEVTDAAGNVGRAAMQITVRDAYKPEVSLNAPANNATLGSSTEVYAYIRDYDSPSVVWKLRLTNKVTGETYVVAEDTRATTGSYDRVLLGRLDPSKYANGDYLLTMEIVDTAGNTAKSEISLKLDTVAPVIESVSMNQTAVETFKPVIFTVNASDNFAVTRYEMYINGEKVTVASNGKSSGYTFKEAGTYRVEAYAYDAAGNVATYSFDLTVVETADLKAPVITINSPYNNYAYNKSVPIQVYIRDTDSLIINWTVTLIDNATGKKTILGAGDREAYYQTVATLSPADYADGSYTVLVEAVDKGGNRSVASNTFIIDTVKPEVSVTPETSRLEVGHTIWFQVSELDASTISRRTFTVNGKSVALDANGRGKYVFDSVGEYTLVATVTDAAGNIGTITRTIVVTGNTDFLAPAVEITSPDTRSYNGGMTSIQGSIADSDSETVSWTVQLRYPNGSTVKALATGVGMVPNGELASFNAASYAAGLYTIEVIAVDPAGNTTVATREMYIDRGAPTISITGPATNAQIKEPTSVTGTLTDKDTATEYVSWSVTITNSSTGDIFTVLTGTGAPVDGIFGVLDPSLYPSGTYKLTLEAVDAGGNKATVSRNIKIDAIAPEVTISSDVQSIEPGQYVTFTMGAIDDVGISTRKLYINGTTYNVGATGVLRVRLTTVGAFEVIAEATDAAGNIGRATMQIAVGVDTVAPVIDSVAMDKPTPETYQPVTFTINASDNYAVTRYEMYINGEKVEVGGNGKVSYMFKNAGTQQIAVYAYDAAGNVATYESNVFVQATSDAPVVSISHNAPSKVYPGQTVEFIVTATGDVDIESLQFLINGQSVSVGADGRVSYTFTGLGMYSIEAIATNIAGNAGSKAFNLEVVAFADIEKPTVNVTHNASPTINPGQTVSFVVTADDNVGVQSLEFTINGEKLAVGADGRVNYQFTALGKYVIKAVAVDAAGNIGVKEFTLTVAAYTDTEAPTVSIAADKTSLTEGGTVSFTVTSNDNVGVAKLTLVINGQNVDIDANGKASHVFASMGVYTAVVIAEDAAGNISTDSIEIKVASINDVKAPTVGISGPASNATIGGAVDITGTIADVDSPEVDWVVTLTDLENNVWVVATGTGKFSNEKICELNPSNFSNGTYTLTVIAEDHAGNRTSASRQVKILSEYKVGNFELPFEDLKIDLGGMPINIVRRYDAASANYKGDFGYGWDLEYIPVSLKTNFKVDPRSSLFDSMDPACGFRIGTKILVTLPDGSTATFTAQASGSFFSYSIVFVCDRSGYTLSLAGASGLQLDGDLFTISGFPYNPLSPWAPQSNANYTLTTPDGMSYTISSVTGLATEARNPKGERITISKNGFVSYNSSGQKIGEVTFTRDSQGRITAITDPDGYSIEYEYDANGDLHAVTNREGERLVYGYVNAEGAPKHRLETITDSRGVTVMRVVYDFVTGRIVGIVDAAGNPIGIGYTVQIGDGLTSEIITDAMGNISETVYDVNGCVVRTIRHIADQNDPHNLSLTQYLITIYEYNSNGKLLGEARAFTVSESFVSGLGQTPYTYVPADLFWTRRNAYDAKGNLASSFDAYGKETKYTYDSKGNVLTVTDPFGNVTTNVYDSKSQLTKTTEPSGAVTSYVYSSQGYLLYIEKTLPDGVSTRYLEMTYDSAGRVKTSTDPAGNITEYKYDGSGRCIESKITAADPDNPSLTHVTVTHTQYDKEGRVLATWRVVDGVEVSRTTNEYDGVGQLVASVDQYGLRTEYVLDILGRTVETRRQALAASGAVVWLVSRTVYDKNGMVTWQTDERIESDPSQPEPAWATHTIYDQLGRVVATERRSDVLVNLDWQDGFPVGAVSFEGVLVSSTSQGYDGVGRVWWSENESGVKTVNVYNMHGEVEYTYIDLDGDLATTADRQASGKFIYDEYGRQVERVLDRDGDLSTTSDQTATRYEYDSLGRMIKTIYADGSFISVSYDAAGRKASETDQLGQTTYYEYDSFDRLTAVVLPKAKHPDSGAMVHVRYEYGYDARGNQISLRDNIFQGDPLNAATIDRSGARETTFTYDWAGRQTSRTLPDGSTEFFFYDQQGRQIRHVSFEGRVTVFEYDAHGRLAKKLYFTSESAWNNGAGISGHTVAYVFDAFGRVVKETDSKQGVTETVYDDLGRVVRVDSPQGVVNYEYDALTGQVSRTWTGLDSDSPITDIVNTYDSLGRLETVTTYAREGAALTNPEATRYIYDIIGNLDKVVNSNGVISDYNYDELNRLKDLTHYAPDATPETLADNAVLQRYEYAYYNNGNKSGETFTDADGKVHTWDWVYDALGRLIREAHDNADDSLDYATNYVYDLVGNRLRKETDQGNDGSVEEVIVSTFDKNDRHLNELKLLDGVATQKTEYLYNKTEQVAKTVTDLVNSRIESETIMEYNAQGRMAKITIMTYVDGSLAKSVTQEYEYDSSGIKVKQTETVDADADGTIDSGKNTEYLNVKQNHTGYSQVLEEYLSEDGDPVKVTTYTIGHDVLTQANALYGILTLLADGHGSTRAVTDRSGAVLQQYSYDAYGNVHGFNPSEAMTNLLYSGEQFNPVSGLQYLRARWYNPQTGTFNRLDPYSGNRESPLSFHKYAYAHMNPVMGVDPSGMFLGATVSTAVRAYQLLIASPYYFVANLALLGYRAVYNGYANQGCPYIPDMDAKFYLGVAGGILGGIAGFATSGNFIFAGLGASFTTVITEALNIWWASTYGNKSWDQINNLEHASYFIDKMVEVAAGVMVDRVVSKFKLFKSDLGKILFDTIGGSLQAAVVDLFSSVPSRLINRFR